jgi:hypothetical protein
VSRRIDIELTSAQPDGRWTWRAAGARQPKGVLDGHVLHQGAKAGDVVRAEADFEIDGITIVSVLPPREKKRPEPERIELLGPSEPAIGGVTTQLVGRSGRPDRRDGGPRREGERRDGDGGSRGASRGGPRPGAPRTGTSGADRPGSLRGGLGGNGPGGAPRGGSPRPSGPRDRGPSDGRPLREGVAREDGSQGVGSREGGPRDGIAARGERQRVGGDSAGRGPHTGRANGGEGAGRGPRRDAGEGRPSTPADRTRGRRLNPANTHRQAVLDALPAEQQPVAEQLLRGGIPAVRTAISLEREKAVAEGRPAPNAEQLLLLAEGLLPRLKTAEWHDRADAASKSLGEISLRDLRSVVAGADAARDDETRALAGSLRDALEARVTTLRTNWTDEIERHLAENRTVRALRLAGRPPETSARLPAELSERLSVIAGAALTPDTAGERWVALLEAVAESPVRRSVKPVGLPADASPEILRAAHQQAGRVPALATLLGIAIPPPPGPRRPAGAPPAAPRPAGSGPADRHPPAPPLGSGLAPAAANAPSPATSVDEPTPTANGPSSAVAEPAGGASGPTPRAEEPLPVPGDPTSGAEEPTPSAGGPTPAAIEPARTTEDLAPVAVEPSEATADPTPAADVLAQAAAQPTAVVTPPPAETTDDPTPAADDRAAVTEDPTPTTNDRVAVTEDPTPAAEDPAEAAEAADDPSAATDNPASAVSEPEAALSEPGAVAAASETTAGDVAADDQAGGAGAPQPVVAVATPEVEVTSAS